MIYLYASLVICIFGVISNTFMTLLLTRPRLGTTINRLLAVVTMSDGLLMFSHIIYMAHFDLGDNTGCPVDKLTYNWVLFQLLHSNWSVYLRAFSLWLSVAMAGYRKHVLSRTQPHQKEKPTFAIILAAIVAFAVFIICMPIFLQNTIVESPPVPENQSLCPKNHSRFYALRPAPYAMLQDQLLLKMAYWTNGILLKLLPCSFLTYYVVRVMLMMYARHRKRQRTLFQNRAPQAGQHVVESGSIRSVMMPTSLILVTVLLTTVLCELPNAILSVMSGLLPHVFLRRTYVYLGEMMDLLSLFSCASTSILYFIMSESLRKAFLDIFCHYGRSDSRMDSPRRIIASSKEPDEGTLLKASYV